MFKRLKALIKTKILLPFRLRNKDKIFCIGLNKTGTTTLQATLKDLGYEVANQRDGELILKDWYIRNFDPILAYCKTAEVFQDVPFSLPYTYVYISQLYPDAKFILSVRDNFEQWYKSLTTFHSKLWGDGQNPPTYKQLVEADYIYKGRPAESIKMIFGTPENDPYNIELLRDFYKTYNSQVRDFFSNSENFLEINVAKKEDYFRLCSFLGVEPRHDHFLWLNKSISK